MTVLFPYTSFNQTETVHYAVQCALKMQAQMARYQEIPTKVGPLSLAMKIGLAMGPILWAIVGDPAIQLEYIIGGRVLDLCAEAEHHARQGEVFVTNNMLDYLKKAQVTEGRGDFSRIINIQLKARPMPRVQQKKISQHVVTTLTRFLHPIIAQRLQAGQSGFINEHRKVTVLFVHFEGFDYDHDPDIFEKLQTYLTAVIRTVHNYDGYLNKVDMGDKGSKYIVLFGTPIIHENDEERALACALELQALSDCLIRVGVNTGFVYCGQVGSQARQEYTVMGDSVNLAARLMQAADTRQILVSEQTKNFVSTKFRWKQLESIEVKGKAHPIRVFDLQRRRRATGNGLQEPESSLPLIDRDQELKQIQNKIKLAIQGGGQLIGITGEAGIGKSRLAAEIINTAEESDFKVYTGACQSHGTKTSYLVWRYIWRGILSVNHALPIEDQRKFLEEQFTSFDPKFLPRIPLIGAVLNIPLPENAFTQTIDTALKCDLLQSLLLAYLTQEAKKRPILLVLEDCHWVDALSRELLEFIGRRVANLPVAILMIYRPPDQRLDVLEWARQLPHFSEVSLAELSLKGARQLVDQKAKQLFESDTNLPDELIDRITSKAEGNPFFIEEMLNFVHDYGVNLKDSRSLQQVDLPESLHSLILSRIDQLAEAEKTTLKVASVIGRVFKANWLWGSYPTLGSPGQVKAHLDILSRLDLTPLDKPEPELEYLFKHITTQEVAYNSLAFRVREKLHEAVGQFIERVYAPTLDQYINVLAHHYSHSQNVAKKRQYFQMAGDAAKAAYANEAALDYYQRLLPLLEESEQIPVMRQLGEIWQLIGRWDEAEEQFRFALNIASSIGDQAAQAHCQNALGQLLAFSQLYEEALKFLQQARQIFLQVHDPVGLSRTLEYISFVHSQQSNYRLALDCAEQQLKVAKECNDTIGISTALKYIGQTYWSQGMHTKALPFLQEALKITTTFNNKREAIQIGSDLAGLYWEMGKLELALQELLQALEVAIEIGDVHTMGMIVANAGEIYRLRGDYHDALICYRQGLQLISEIGDRTMLLTIISNIADVCITLQNQDEAEYLLSRLIPLRRELNTPYFLCEDLYRNAKLLFQQHRLVKAQRFNSEALELAVQAENKSIQFQIVVLSYLLQLALGEMNIDVATTKLSKLLEDWPEDREQASIYYEWWCLDPENEVARQNAANLFRDLYKKTPSTENRQCYMKLTGERLPELPYLSKPPNVIDQHSISLESLLTQIESKDKLSNWV